MKTTAPQKTIIKSNSYEIWQWIAQNIAIGDLQRSNHASIREGLSIKVPKSSGSGIRYNFLG